MSLTPDIRIERDRACLRGLHYRYHFEEPISEDAFCARLQAALPDRFVVGVEHWGTTRVVRLIWQFRFEVRVICGPPTISITHRVCCAEEQRLLDREWLRRQLLAALEEGNAHA